MSYIGLGLGTSVAKNLIVTQGLGLGLGLNIIVDADGVVNIFSSCCLDKFP